MNNYTVYHLHSDYSLLDSTTKFQDYIDKAKKLGMKSIGRSEHGNIFNWIKIKQACDKAKIKYMHGIEIYLTETLDIKVRDNYHTILYAKNFDGVLELNKLVSISNDSKHFYYKPRISFDEFLNTSDNIISISACMASPLNNLMNKVNSDRAINEERIATDTHVEYLYKHYWQGSDEVRNREYGEFEKTKENIEKLYSIKEKKLQEYFERLVRKYDFLEIQPHYKSSDQKIYNIELYNLSKKYNKKLIMGTDTHEVDTYKQECRKILKTAKKMLYVNEDDFDLTFRSFDELVIECGEQDCFEDSIYLEAIENTNVLSDMIENFELDKSFKYPKLYENEELQYTNLIKSKLEYKTKNNIIDISRIEEYRNKLNLEFLAFKKQGMLSYILFVSELCDWCSDNNIPIGFGRGSVTGSTSAYISDITDVDPIKRNTIFSRFCNDTRISLADIDLDFAPQDRGKVYKYISDRFPNNSTSYIVTFNSISEKGTIGEITRALKYDFQKSMDIKNEFEENEELCRKKYEEVFYYYDGLINTYISSGKHPCGFLGSLTTLDDNLGFYYDKGVAISQCDMKAVDSLNYVKFDILGLKNIGIIKEVYQILGVNYKKSHEIDWDDKDVWNDIVTSPVGIFQFESPYSFGLLKQFLPQQVDDLSLLNASLRPSGESYRDSILKREFHHNPTKEIDELLKNNYGYLVYQEDQIKFLQEICGFSGGEADTVRRAIGKKDEKLLADMLPKVKEGYIKNSSKDKYIAEEEVGEFIQVLSDSSDYAFGFNHSTSYSMIGYTCAYLRYHHPIEFITAFLNTAQNEDDTRMGFELSKLKNIKINPITFGKSTDRYNIKDGEIYKGMSSVKFINSQIPEELNELYKENLSFPQLLSKIKINTSVNSRQLDVLIKIGYFKDYGGINKLLEYLEWNSRFSKKTYKLEGIDEDIEKYITYGYRKEIIKERVRVKKDIWDKCGSIIEEKRNTYIVEYDKEIMIYPFCEKTKTMYKNIDKEYILDNIWNNLADDNIDLLEKLKYEMEYLGYISEIPNNISVAKAEMVSVKYKSVNLKSMRNGDNKWVKFKKDEVVLPKKGDIILFKTSDMYSKIGYKGRRDLYIKRYEKL